MSSEESGLADELFALVERDQGYSYISDGNGHMTRDQIVAVARASLEAHERCARALRRWLADSAVRHGRCEMPHVGRHYAAWLCVVSKDGAGVTHLHVCGTHARGFTGRERFKVQPIEKGKKLGSRTSTGCPGTAHSQ